MQFQSFFPLNQRVIPGNLASLILTVVLYLLICSAFGLVIFLVGWLPIVGWLLRVVSAVLELYCLVGMILAIMRYFK
ncbi:MAG: hypothetical protein KH420_09145 [Clostridiales bacterium]|nr:hypothetical protein [Clostridiales bacterium]